MATLTSTIVDSNGTTLSQTTITVLDAKLAAGVNAFAARNGYQALIPDPNADDGSTIPNPENKYDFMVRKMREYAANEINAYLVQAAAATAAAAVTPVNLG